MDSWPKFNLHTKQSPGAVNSCVFFRSTYSKPIKSQPVKLSASQSIASYCKPLCCLSFYSCVQSRFIRYPNSKHQIISSPTFLWIRISLGLFSDTSVPVQFTACIKIHQESDFINTTADLLLNLFPVSLSLLHVSMHWNKSRWDRSWDSEKIPRFVTFLGPFSTLHGVITVYLYLFTYCF